MESDVNPKHPAQRLQDAPRCTARAKSTGCACKSPAVKGWRVCRLHGAGGGAPRGAAHPNYRHGGRTREVAEIRRLGAMFARMARDATKVLHS